MENKVSDTQQDNGEQGQQTSVPKAKKPRPAKVLASPVVINPELKKVSATEAVVVSFARMNPVTIGHERLVKTIDEIAEENNCDGYLFLSHTRDRKRNPLRYEDKFRYAREAFGSIVQESSYIDFFDMMRGLSGKYKNIHVVVGSDRLDEMTFKLNEYNGREYHYDNIKVHSAGLRDPDAEGPEGASASRMRFLAVNEDYAMFRFGLPISIQHLSDEIAHKLRVGMGIEEGIGKRVLKAIRS